MGTETRLATAIPPRADDARERPVVGGWHVELPDPTDPDERSALIRLAHPQLDEAIEDGVEELVLAEAPMNPRLHLVIHEIVAGPCGEAEQVAALAALPGSWDAMAPAPIRPRGRRSLRRPRRG